jgi:transcriptional antiterminator NusG
MSDNNFYWYVLKAISGKEQKVKEYIEAACKTTDIGRYVSQVLVPTEKTTTQSRTGKRVSKERLYLPGYVLVECRAISECASRLRAVPNVLGFLPNDRIPTPVRQTEINRIVGNVDEQDIREVEEFPFLVGEKVKVADGPFNGFIGVINEILTDKKKIKVEVTIFGRKTPLELSFNQVDKE